MNSTHPALTRLAAWVAGYFGRAIKAAPTLAVFIDGDGVSPRDARRVLEHLTIEGRICVLRSYGNFTGKSAEGWAKLIRSLGVTARHMTSLVPGKNATDIALAIDAIEVLLTRNADTFVIVASDADFTPLACRLRESGKRVLVYGSRSTPESLRGACTDFHDIGQLGSHSHPQVPSAPFWSLQPNDAAGVVMHALASLGGEGEPVALSVLGARLGEQQPGFDSRTYSRRTLGDLIRDLPSIKLLEQDGKRFAVREQGSD